VRDYLKVVLLAGLAAATMLEAVSSAAAADLTAAPRKRVTVIHHRARIVADYDGTAIMLRRVRPVLVRSAEGTVVAMRPGRYEAHAMLGAIPLRYFTGQPIR
jgi:hypothetical protein